MKVRCALNERSELVDGEGNVLGRVLEIVVELSPLPKGESLGKDNSNVKSKEAFGQESSEPSPEVAEVWSLYGQLISSKRQLGPKQHKDIERALKVRDLATVKWAVVGLSRSPHHNGQNDQGTKYLDIRYALRGNGARGESNEERIDRMAELGKAAGTPLPTPQEVVDGFVPVDQLSSRTHHGDIAQLLDAVRRNARRPPYPEDRLGFVDVLEVERIERRDVAITELRDRFGIESRISADGKSVTFKETPR
jgi:hypothetical protein